MYLGELLLHDMAPTAELRTEQDAYGFRSRCPDRIRHIAEDVLILDLLARAGSSSLAIASARCDEPSDPVGSLAQAPQKR